MTIATRRGRVLAALVPAVLSLSCFDQPITESMEIRFLPSDAAMIRVTVRLADPRRFKDSAAVRDRIEAARRAIVELRDPWSDRIRSLSPEAERITWDRREGQVVRFDHKAVVADTEHLHSFFKDTLIHAGVTRWEDAAELMLTPTPGSRAGREQQERFAGAMKEWAGVVARYLEAGDRLYDYLEANPGRARACFTSLFKDLLPEGVAAEAEPLTDQDADVLDPFSDAMGELLGLFSLPPGEAYSIEELSALVNDPFPAPLTVRVPGPILAVEGFETGAEGALLAPPVSLWSAFVRLEERWIAPNPAVVTYRHLGEGKPRLDLDAFLALPRSARTPSGPGEVGAAFAQEMRAAPVYRVRWSTAGLEAPEGEGEGEGEIWDLPALQ